MKTVPFSFVFIGNELEIYRPRETASYPGAMCCSMACVAFAWAAWINLIDFVVRRLAESVSISGADSDFWSGLNKLGF